MATTSVSNIIIPALWLPYTIQRTAALSELVTSGIIASDATFDTLASSGGDTVNMPFWLDISGASEVINSGTTLTTANLGTDKDIAVFQARAKAWQHEDLAGIMAGSDPANALAELVASYWAREMQTITLSVLSGVFKAASMATNKLAIHHTSGGAGGATAANRLNASTFIDATQLMGDQKAKLTALIMHSAVESYLRKLNLIDFLPASEQGKLISFFQGHRVIIDDTMPTATVDGELVFTTYLFGTGALALGNDSVSAMKKEDGMTPASTWGVEFVRNGLSGISGMINRRRFILHPRGVKWSGTKAGQHPTNGELDTSTSFTRVYEQKNVRMVQITHNIG